jgi:hypothetical protein
MAGSGGRIIASDDGVTFTDVNYADEDLTSFQKLSGDNDDGYRGFCAGKDSAGQTLIVLAGGGSLPGCSGSPNCWPGRISRSYDGKVWLHSVQFSIDGGKTYVTESRLPETNWLGQCAYDGQKFVLTGGAGISLFSTNGSKWIMNRNLSTNINFGANRAMVYGNGLFVTASDHGSFYSSDGINWFEGRMNQGNQTLASLGYKYSSITYGTLPGGAGRFVMGNYSSNKAPTLYSDDGQVWQPVTIQSSSTTSPLGITNLQFYNGRFYGNAGSHSAAVSSDGINWKAYVGGKGNPVLFGKFGMIAGEWMNPVYRAPDMTEPAQASSRWPINDFSYANCVSPTTGATSQCLNDSNRNYFTPCFYFEF